MSRPFPKPKPGQIAVKVISHYGDEVLKVYRVAAHRKVAGDRVAASERRFVIAIARAFGGAMAFALPLLIGVLNA